MKLNLFTYFWRHNSTLVGHNCFVIKIFLKRLPQAGPVYWNCGCWKIVSLSSSSTYFLKFRRVFKCICLEWLNTLIWNLMILNALAFWGSLEFVLLWKVSFRLAWLWREGRKLKVTTEKAKKKKSKARD